MEKGASKTEDGKCAKIMFLKEWDFWIKITFTFGRDLLLFIERPLNLTANTQRWALQF